MPDRSYTTTFTVDQTPEQAFGAINNVRGWWTGDIEGATAQLGDQFTYRYQDIHRSTQKITEMVPGRKIAWHVVDGYLNFVKDEAEWTGTNIIFDIVPVGDKTEIRFTHVGLTPAGECFDKCSSAWAFYINGSLRNFIATSNVPAEQLEG